MSIIKQFRRFVLIFSIYIMKRFRLNFFNLGLLLLASIGISMYLNKSIKEGMSLREEQKKACKGMRGRKKRKCKKKVKARREEEQRRKNQKKVVKKEEKNDCGPAVASIKKKFCDLKL